MAPSRPGRDKFRDAATQPRVAMALNNVSKMTRETVIEMSTTDIGRLVSRR